MIKVVLLVLLTSLLLKASSNEYSLKDDSKVVNISTNTIDTKEVLLKVDEEVKNFDFNALNKFIGGIDSHKSRLKLIQKDMKGLANLKTELELNYLDIKHLESTINEAKEQYDRKINRIYKQNKHIEREMYILVALSVDESETDDVENFIIEKLAIKKYDQTTTLRTTLASTDLKSKIKTDKDFGQKSIDTLASHIVRDKGLVFKVLKVVQNPFVKTKKKSKKGIQKDNEQFKESNILIYDLNQESFKDVSKNIQKKFKVNSDELNSFIKSIKSKVDVVNNKIAFDISSKNITQVLKILESRHSVLAKEVYTLSTSYAAKKDMNKDIELKLNKLLKETKRLLKPYNILLTKENIGTITLVTPKIYSEKVQFKEEKEYVLRKVKSYISKINIADLKQSDVLIDFMDLSSTTKNLHKIIKFETIHFVPYLQDNNNIGLFIFSTISVKDKISDDDLVEFSFKNSKIQFIPIKQGYKTIFVAQTQVTLGMVKEFLETNSYKKHFDQYCINESFLPEEAKDYKNISEEFYEYPAICFKVDYVENFIKWASKKTNRELVIPDAKDWSFVASNSDTTEYCWGNEEPQDLLEDGVIPENIYIENSDEESTIKKVAQYPKSKSGIYDMCGNVFELTMQEGDFSFKGNSFSSYVASSRGEADSYSDDINAALGLRLFYIKDLTDD